MFRNPLFCVFIVNNNRLLGIVPEEICFYVLDLKLEPLAKQLVSRGVFIILNHTFY